MISRIYEGTVRHRRYSPVLHDFRYRVFMMYLDLDEVDTLFDGRMLWSASGRAVAEFRRSDFLGDPAVPLADAVRDVVALKTGARPAGPVRLLTNLRYFGYIQNPVSFYYCYAADGETLEAVVAEVTNTPWGDRHAYVLRATQSVRVHGRMAKALHVSPFMPMQQSYAWWMTKPAPKLTIHMQNIEDDARVFDATMVLRAHPVTPRALRAVLVRFPLMTVRVVTAIYWQAARLRLKGVQFHPHPDTRNSDGHLVTTR